jgi:hypothetical protein
MKMPDATRATTENGIISMKKMLVFNPRPNEPPTALAHPGQARALLPPIIQSRRQSAINVA